LLPYLGCVLGVWGSWRILERFVAALDESQALNRDLERRVEERGDEIARSYERINSLERERAVQDERARLMQDIHDGFGAQLTSMLALVETAEATPGEVADALRDALDDMRLVIQSLGPRDADLIALLASWRARVERRLQRRGLRFDWQVSDLPVLPWLGPRESLHVLRIFQETVSNVLQHAAATTITVRTGERVGTDGRQGVYVQIDDDGRGFAPDGRDGAAPGAGLRNITRRARDLGGVVSIGRETGGGRVVLWLPRDSA
jgi:signal transduction histidine kinase